MSFTAIEQATPRLQRSELAVPGTNPALFRKAANSNADIIFLDCEDAVAPDDKERARAAATTVLQTMVGANGIASLTADRYLTPQVWVALMVGVVGAGPMIPWISRWRVAIDGITVAAVMMVASVPLLLWRVGSAPLGIFPYRRRGGAAKE